MSSSAVPVPRQVSGSPAQGLWGATLGFFFGFAAVSLFGPTAKAIKDLIGLSPTEVGFLVAIPSLTGSLLRIPFGAWVDTTGGRKPFLWLLGLACVGMAGLSVLLLSRYPDGLRHHHYPLLLVLGALAGCGIATFSVGIGQVSYWHAQDAQGAALGKYAGYGNLAPGLFAFLLPVVMATTGLKGAYVIWTGLLLAGTLLYAALGRNAWFFELWNEGRGMNREDAEHHARELGQELFPQAGGVWRGLLATARLPATWALVALYFVSFGGFLALTAWFPTYWQEAHGTSATLAGGLTMLYSVGASLIRVPGGAWSDRFGGGRVAVFSFALTAVGASLLALGAGFAVSVIGLVAMAAGMGVANGAVFKLVPLLLAGVAGGAGAGWVGGLGAFGGFVLPPLLGWFVDRFGAPQGYPLGFVVFAILAVCAGVLSGALDRSVRRSQSGAEEGPERAAA